LHRRNGGGCIEPIPTLLLSPRAILPIRHVQDDFEFADIEEAIRELKAGRNDKDLMLCVRSALGPCEAKLREL
jgi:hypothetical protein